jgi:hypothetical protein
MPAASDLITAYEGLLDHSIVEADYWEEKNNRFWDEHVTFWKDEADRALKTKTALVQMIDKGVRSEADEGSKLVGGRMGNQ